MYAAIAYKRAELCRCYGVARLEIFGSAARGTDFEPQTSDADFLVEFDPGGGLLALVRGQRSWNQRQRLATPLRSGRIASLQS